MCAKAVETGQSEVPTDDTDPALVQEALTNARPPSGDADRVDALIERLQDDDSHNNPHAFVVMPFGQKCGPDGKRIDFDAIFGQLIRPALIEAGFAPFRADEETVSGDILTDMFQELLLADLVIVDMSIDNANVFYELGVRHAFRRRGIVHIQSGRAYMPFDVFNVRTMPYHIDDAGRPDNLHVERDRKNLIRVTRDTWASDADAVHSPIFGLLTGLVEPDRRTLRTPLATGFWREFNQWEERIAIARRQKRVGDILLLTDEIINPLCKEDAVAQTGLALREMGRGELALQEYRKGLAINPKNREFRREEAVLLNRMGRVDEAIIKLEGLLTDEPSETRATSYLGRIYTSLWREYWIGIDDPDQRRQAAFDAYQWAIKSIDTYLKGFNVDRNNLEPGIKALTIASLLVHLADRHDDPDDPDADVQRVRSLLPGLRSTLRFSLDADARRRTADYWTWASLGTWMISGGRRELAVSRSYRKALSFARKNVFHLRSSLRQLDLFHDLGIHVEQARVGRQIVQSEIDRIEGDGLHEGANEYPPPDSEVLSFLFGGHMLDRPDRELPRFPIDLEDEVRRQIDRALDTGKADSNDHGFTSGAACGGDIIFIEACLARGMKVHVHMPCAEAQYVNESVGFGGTPWIERFYALRNDPRVNLYFQQERLGEAGDDVDPYERNARWALYASLVFGVDKLRMIALWDGKTDTALDADGERVSAMVRLTGEMGGMVEHLDIDKLDYLFKQYRERGLRDTTACVGLDDRVVLLQRIGLFEPLHVSDLTQIARVLVERRYVDQQLLARQDDVGDEFFIIVSGEVSVQVEDTAARQQEVIRRQPGDYVGEMSLIHDQPRMASLVAMGDVLVLLLDRRSFARIMCSRPETAQALTRMLAGRLVEMTRQETLTPTNRSDAVGEVLPSMSLNRARAGS